MRNELNPRDLKLHTYVKIIAAPRGGEEFLNRRGLITKIPNRSNGLFFHVAVDGLKEKMLAIDNELTVLGPLEILAECAESE